MNRGKKGGKATRPRSADGYYAVQLGFDDKPARVTNKAQIGHNKKPVSMAASASCASSAWTARRS